MVHRVSPARCISICDTLSPWLMLYPFDSMMRLSGL